MKERFLNLPKQEIVERDIISKDNSAKLRKHIRAKHEGRKANRGGGGGSSNPARWEDVS